MNTVSTVTKALQTALHKHGIAYKCGRYDDPNTKAHTQFHLFDPGQASTCTVLFHGTGNDALFCWEEIILSLTQNGRAVLAFDLPGHGQNSSTELNEVFFASCGHFLPTLLAQLLPQVKSLEAVGYSLGGLAALQLATHSILRWKKLVLIALPERVEIGIPFALSEALSFLARGFWRQVLRFGWQASFPAFGPVRRQRFPLRLTQDITIPYPQFIDRLFQKADVAAQLRALLIPVLLIYGTRDRLATVAYGRTLAGDLRLVEGANHFLLPLEPTTSRLLVQWLLTSPQRPAENSIPR